MNIISINILRGFQLIHLENHSKLKLKTACEYQSIAHTVFNLKSSNTSMKILNSIAMSTLANGNSMIDCISYKHYLEVLRCNNQ
mmetsp:Transcript_11149/g.14550  ORF Transcript_11149/g.14550 Transcript_11149/m.14550 type:complete len:84 (-) Transcript_11149:450-701(-)